MGNKQQRRAHFYTQWRGPEGLANAGCPSLIQIIRDPHPTGGRTVQFGYPAKLWASTNRHGQSIWTPHGEPRLEVQDVPNQRNEQFCFSCNGGGERGMDAGHPWPLPCGRPEGRPNRRSCRFVVPSYRGFVIPLSAAVKKKGPADGEPFLFNSGGERGIRTLDRLLTYTPLAGARFRPLSHLSVVVKRRRASAHCLCVLRPCQRHESLWRIIQIWRKGWDSNPR